MTENKIQSDYEKIIEKLAAVDGEFKAEFTNETDALEPNLYLESFSVGGTGVILVSDDTGDCGLYSFVGKDSDPVERDLAFIESLSKNQSAQIYYEYWQGTRSKKWFWHAKAMNHEVVCQGETNGYHNKADCLRAIDLLKSGAAAEVKERGKL